MLHAPGVTGRHVMKFNPVFAGLVTGGVLGVGAATTTVMLANKSGNRRDNSADERRSIGDLAARIGLGSVVAAGALIGVGMLASRSSRPAVGALAEFADFGLAAIGSGLAVGGYALVGHRFIQAN